MTTELVLASASVSRRAMLEAAGVPFTVAVPAMDEEVLKSLLCDSGTNADALAGELAEAKALSLSRNKMDALVLSGDQVLACDGRIFNKAMTENEARETLRALSDREHRLISAAVIAREGTVVWRWTETATLRMRRLSVRFIESYLAAEIPEVLGSVGCYRIEGRGAQLFAEISGDHFCIRGLPLIPVLSALRNFGVIPA